MSLQHFVLTRFNIASIGREASIRSRPGWLERRFKLFERYCLPSVANQDSFDFQWLIYFDVGTPESFRQRIRELNRDRVFEAIFVEDFDARMAAGDVAKRTREETSRIVTTRLDNDDALERTFLSGVRQHSLDLPNGTIINFPRGFSLADGRIYTAFDPQSPFCSLVEPAHNARTVWAESHPHLYRTCAAAQFDTVPSWLQVVHGENVSNRVKGRLVSDINQLGAFGIETSTFARLPSALDIALDRSIFHPLRVTRELAISGIRQMRDWNRAR